MLLAGFLDFVSTSSPAVKEGSTRKVLAVRSLGGVDHSEPVQAEHLTPGRVRHPGVELVEPGGL